MGPLLLIGNFLSCCITESMAASIDGVMVCTVLATLQIRRLLGSGKKVLTGCSLGQGEAAVVMTSMVAVVAMMAMVAVVAVWPSVCSPVSGPQSGLGPLPTWASLVSCLVTATLSSPAQGREARLQITLVPASILFI